MSFTCRGHPAVRATHGTSVELTRDPDITERATCVVGVAGTWDEAELRRLAGRRVSVTLASGGHEDSFEAEVTPLYLSGRLVFRRGGELAERTFAFRASKAADDLDRDLVAALRSPDAVLSVTIRPMPEAAGGNGRRGALYVVGLPIGNYDDLSPRARRTLELADLVLAEDTRRYRVLARDVGLPVRELWSLHAGNEDLRIPKILELLRAGRRVALVSDAGTPLVSDPGLLLTRRVAAEGLPVRPVPGPSAPIAALSAAGLPAGRFAFAGFLPRRTGQRRARLAELASRGDTVVIFEAASRLAGTLADVAAELPGRALCVARELTKIHEQIVHTTTDDAAEALAGVEPRGEYTLVVGPDERRRRDEAGGGADEQAGPGERAGAELDPVVLRLIAELGDRVPTKEVAEALRAASGLSRRQAYDVVLRARTGG